jgi:hypothetical protein
MVLIAIKHTQKLCLFANKHPSTLMHINKTHVHFQRLDKSLKEIELSSPTLQKNLALF